MEMNENSISNQVRRATMNIEELTVYEESLCREFEQTEKYFLRALEEIRARRAALTRQIVESRMEALEVDYSTTNVVPIR